MRSSTVRGIPVNAPALWAAALSYSSALRDKDLRDQGRGALYHVPFVWALWGVCEQSIQQQEAVSVMRYDIRQA